MEDNVKTKQELVNELKEIRWRIDELKEKGRMDHSASSAVATADLEGNMTYVNPTFLRLWDIDDTRQIYGKPFRTFREIEERLDEMFHVLERDGKWLDEIKARKKDGTVVPQAHRYGGSLPMYPSQVGP